MMKQAVAAVFLAGVLFEPAAAASFKKADAALNAVYSDLTRLLSSPSVQKLRASQRAWLAFRDAECALQGSAVEGGSAKPMVVSQCMARLTEERVRQLRYYLNCEEGDLSCPR